MKKITNRVIALFILVFAIASCSDDDSTKGLPAGVLSTFNTQFSNVSDLSWHYNGTYYQLDFEINQMDYSAWYLPAGTWEMTLNELTYGELPTSLQTAYESSQFKENVVANCYILERPNFMDNYLIESNGILGKELPYFSPDGTLLYSGEALSVDDIQPTLVPSSIVSTIDTSYPGAEMVGIGGNYMDNSSGYRVIIYDASIYKYVFFNNSYDWLYSNWIVSESSVPEVVMATYQASPVTQLYSLIDVNYYQMSTPPSYYSFKLSSEQPNISSFTVLNIDIDGNVID